MKFEERNSKVFFLSGNIDKLKMKTMENIFLTVCCLSICPLCLLNLFVLFTFSYERFI